MSNGGPVQSVANLAKGQDKGNAVSIQVSTSQRKRFGLPLNPSL